jgi:hypothetical protein
MGSSQASIDLSRLWLPESSPFLLYCECTTEQSVLRDPFAARLDPLANGITVPPQRLTFRSILDLTQNLVHTKSFSRSPKPGSEPTWAV